MATPSRVKLGTLLNATFEIPGTGVVNLRLLFELLRSLISRLGLSNLEVDIDVGPESSSSRALASSIEADAERKLEDGDRRPEDVDRSPEDGDLGILPFSSSLLGMSPEERAKEMARRRAAETTQVLNLLKAYLTRLQSLEAGLSDLRAKRAEDLEVMAKMLNQINMLDARLCNLEKMLAKLAADMECLGLATMDYDLKIEDIYRQLDHTGAEVDNVKCELRCVQKDRQQFVDAVRTVTEQFNFFSGTKADKDFVERELALRALVEDMEKRVPFECYSLAQMEFAKGVARLHEAIYKLEQALRTKVYEVTSGFQRKADSGDVDDLRRQVAKILVKLKCMEMNSHSRAKTAAAGVALRNTGSAQCLTCGSGSTLEGDCHLIPRAVQFIPPSKKKDIFTLQSRYCGGDFTITKPPEKVVLPGPILGLDCTTYSKHYKQIVGGDGCVYLADPFCSEPNQTEK